MASGKLQSAVQAVIWQMWAPTGTVSPLKQREEEEEEGNRGIRAKSKMLARAQGRITWDAFQELSRGRSSPTPLLAMPSWLSVPGPQAGGSNSTHFLSFSEAEVCDQGAGETGLPEPSASGLWMVTLLLSLCLVPCVHWCFAQSQDHQLFRNSVHLLPHSDLTTSLETLHPQTGSFAFTYASPFSLN